MMSINNKLKAQHRVKTAFIHKATFCVSHISGAGVKTCWTVNYVRNRICALEGFSVNISSKYSHPENQWPKSKFWYKKRSGETKGEKLTEHDVEYHDNKNHHILTINSLKKNHSAEYVFRLQENNKDCKWSELPGVTLVVTGNNKKRKVDVSLQLSLAAASRFYSISV